jgi:L-alanine-DL-glutamate epimerase-like enolase superfamily enzyme
LKIKYIHAWRQNLALRKPYTIARHTITDVENIFLEIELENGIRGIGAANPDEDVVGETCDQTFQHCTSPFFDAFVGRDIRHFNALIRETAAHFPKLPGVLAACDIALHDAFAQYLGIPVATFYGQKITSLPTSVTIGIMPVEETLREAQEYVRMGFHILKVKTGHDAAEDIDRIRALKTSFPRMTVRVDANQGYNLPELKTFLQGTFGTGVELIEQPLPAGQETALLDLPPYVRRTLAADESLLDAASSLKLLPQPQPFGIFNIKLMKCGGIRAALDIADIARHSGIDLFWGCNDESIVSISAALHAAFACEHTRYIDLDGSFDLAEDIVSGGFILENGHLSLTGMPGLGFTRL